MKYMKTSIKIKYGVALIFALSMLMPSLAVPLAASAQTLTSPTDNVNLNDSKLKIIVCDGPDLSSQKSLLDAAEYKLGRTYVPCNFNGLMLQIQHLIDIAIVFGVVVAIGLFSYAGYMYISAGMRGDSNAHSTALNIFRKVGIGFIIMLSAWFIVYQVIIWLTGSSQFAVLLGK
jgi:hypothetical protein